jgi:protein-S-isoprenylcysteine O-methyltransferase Ste14
MSRCPLNVNGNGRETPRPRPQLCPPGAAARLFVILVGVGAVIATWAFFASFIIFLGNLPHRAEPWIEPSIDTGFATDWTPSMWLAVLNNLVLIALFGLQHSGMARPSFKTWLTRFVPAAFERTVYVYAACVIGFLLIALWCPIPIVVWRIEDGALRTLMWGAFTAGWAILLVAALSIDMPELLGLKQCWAYYMRRSIPSPALKTGAIYHWLAHPMYVGVLLGVWCAPHMTLGHMLLALGLTTYIAVGRMLEERDLAARFGPAYTTWRRTDLWERAPRTPAARRTL